MAETEVNLSERARHLSALLQQHGRVTEDDLAEILVAAALGGQWIGGNNAGFHVQHPELGRIEVRSRILGTDGPLPRVTLSKSKIDGFDHLAALRFRSDFRFHDAIMLDHVGVMELYANKKQDSGLAHIAWSDWLSHPRARSLMREIEVVLIAA